MVRALVACRPIGRAVVLGSTQEEPAGEMPLGASLTRRSSGGGAVWVAPGEMLWVDIDLPRDDPLWDDDVGRSFLWLGRAWVSALAKVGVKGASLHEGGLVCGPTGRTICFATRGPGEVFVAGRKVVGITQRRTREGTRFHCAALLRWSPNVLARALGIPEGQWPQLKEVAAGLDVSADALLAALIEAMPKGSGS